MFVTQKCCFQLQVFDGEGGTEHRRQLLPSYKAHRRKFLRQLTASQRFSRGRVGRSHQFILDVLRKCNVPVSEASYLCLFSFISTV